MTRWSISEAPVNARFAPLAVALLAAGLACRPGAQAAAPAAAAPAPVAAPATRPRLVEPERVRFAPALVANGTLKARQSAPLAMPVGGTLEHIAVKRGQEVKAGALLATLDAGAAAAAKRQAEAAVGAAKAQRTLAEDALRRVTAIREQEGASEADLVKAQAQRDLAASQVAAAEAQLAQAAWNLGHHTLEAPFAGVVTKIPDGVGITVGAGTPIVVLVATRELVLETSLTQEEAAELRAGAPVTVTVPASGARTAEATLAVVVPAVDPATNRVPVEITVPNRDGRFLANAYARADLGRAAERDAWRIPSASLTQREGGFAVWIAGADGAARTLPVRVLGNDGGGAVVVPRDGAWPAGVKVVGAPPLGIAEGTIVAEAAR
jgi:RND family efflux transporter MFP subunit